MARGIIRSSLFGVVLLGASGVSAYAADLGPAPVTVAPPSSWWSDFKFDAMVEGGFTGNPAGPPNPPGNFGQLFTDQANMFLMNQLLLTAHRDVDEKKDWDLGVKVQFMYGTDARYTRYLGEFPNAVDGLYAPAIQEAWVDVKTPWFGKGGTDFKVGQFVTPLGVEVIDPRGNFFYSHSYLFNFGLPLENTGVLAVTHVNDTLDLYGGVDTGVNTTFGPGIGDPTGTASFNAGFGLNKLMNGKLTILALTHIGPSDPGDNSDSRYLSDAYATYKFNDKLTWTTELNYAYDSINKGQNGWGIVEYLTYTYNDWLSLGVRGEYWDDINGFWVAAFPCPNCFIEAEEGSPQARILGAGKASYTELTFGANIKPFSKATYKPLANLLIRPEIRWDHSFDANAFDNFSEPNQLTLMSDFIFTWQ